MRAHSYGFNSPERSKAVACTVCRDRKLKCDMQGPCESCCRRGEMENCSSWDQGKDTPPVLSVRPVELRKLVDRLEVGLSQIGVRRPTNPQQPQQQYSEPSPTTFLCDTKAIREQLITPATFVPKVIGSMPFVGHEVRGASVPELEPLLQGIRALDPHLFRPIVAPETTAPLSAFSSRPLDLTAIFSILPTKSQLEVLLDVYVETSDIFVVLDRATFRTEANTTTWPPTSEEQCWLAACCAAAALGLRSMSDLMSSRLRLPTGEAKKIKVGQWIECALVLLRNADYPMHPCLDSLRAVALVNVFWLGDRGGSNLQHATAFNSTAVGVLFALELHRDPSELGGFSQAAANDRRRVFHAFAGVEILSRHLFGRTYSLLDLSGSNVKPPSNLPLSSSLTPNLPRPMLRDKITFSALSVLSELHVTLRSPPQKVSYNQFLQWHSTIVQLQNDMAAIPARSGGCTTNIVALLAFTAVRLHWSLSPPSMRDTGINVSSHRSNLRRNARTLASIQMEDSSLTPSLALALSMSGVLALSTDLYHYTSEPEAPGRRRLLESHLVALGQSGIYKDSPSLARTMGIAQALLVASTSATPAAPESLIPTVPRKLGHSHSPTSRDSPPPDIILSLPNASTPPPTRHNINPGALHPASDTNKGAFPERPTRKRARSSSERSADHVSRLVRHRRSGSDHFSSPGSKVQRSSSTSLSYMYRPPVMEVEKVKQEEINE